MSLIKRSLVTLLLAPVVLGATLPGTTFAAPARQPITLRAILHSHTVQVTGTNFDAGAKVGLVLIETRGWKTLFQGTATAEAGVYACPRSANTVCGELDPNAGQLSFTFTLKQRANPSNLAVLYRSGTEVGFGRVRSQ